MSRFDQTGEFELDGERFAWVVKHYAGMTNSNAQYRGVTARVTLVGGNARELIVEFHPDDYPGQRVSSVRQFEERLIENTRKGIELGWRPDSRGKPFRIEVEKAR